MLYLLCCAVMALQMEMEISLERLISCVGGFLKTWHTNFRKFKALLFQKTVLCIVVYVSLYVVLKPYKVPSHFMGI